MGRGRVRPSDADDDEEERKHGLECDCDEFVTKGFVDNFLAYRTTRRVKMKVPLVGAVYRFAQFSSVVYVIYSIYVGNLWAEVSEPRGIIEAQPEEGISRLKTEVGTFSEIFCGNPAYAYALNLGADGMRRWDTPTCRGEEMPMVATKSDTAVHFVTAMREAHTYGFPCRTSTPDACSGQPVHVKASGQCVCEVWETVYPVGVEDMLISVDHAYRVDKWDAEDGWFGSSILGAKKRQSTEDAALDTTVYFQNGSSLVLPAGNRLSLTVGTWLSAAGVSLDERNAYAKPDAERATEPFFRTTGVRIEVSERAVTQEWWW